MTEYMAGDTFEVTRDTVVLRGEDIPVERIEIKRIESEMDYVIDHLGEDERLPIATYITESDLKKGIGDWLDPMGEQ